MTTKNTPAAAPLSLPRYNASENRLTYTVSRSPRLAALLPADEVTPLIEAHDRAVKLAAEAAAVRFKATDPADEVRAAVQNGTDVDVPGVIAAMAAARTAKIAHEEAARFFETLAPTYKQDLSRLIADREDDLYEGLAEQLDAVLNEAETVLRDLGGITDAEAALDADKAAEFRRFRALAETYAELREAHRKLLFAARDNTLSNRSQGLAKAMFASAEEFLPKRPDEGVRYAGLIQPETPPVDLFDTASRDHFAFVVKNRAALRPRVVTAGAATSIPLDNGVQFAPRPLTERDRYMFREAANARANEIAEQREGIRGL